MLHKAFCTALLVLVFSACDRRNPRGPNHPDRSEGNVKAFTAPAIPSVYTTSQQKTDYLIDNYWNHFPFDDTTLLQHSRLPEEAFTQYLSILHTVSPVMAEKGVSRLIQLVIARQQAFRMFVQLAEKYFHQPGSPFRNDLLYEPFLKAAIASPYFGIEYKAELSATLGLLQKNKPGIEAADFRITLYTGASLQLSDIASEFLLLYFYHPECAGCITVKQQLIGSNKIQELTSKKQLTIVTLFADKEFALWREHYNELPANWINGYDKERVILEKELYDLSAIPTLYLLNHHKQVMLRDATVEEIEAMLP